MVKARLRLSVKSLTARELYNYLRRKEIEGKERRQRETDPSETEKVGFAEMQSSAQLPPLLDDRSDSERRLKKWQEISSLRRERALGSRRALGLHKCPHRFQNSEFNYYKKTLT